MPLASSSAMASVPLRWCEYNEESPPSCGGSFYEGALVAQSWTAESWFTAVWISVFALLGLLLAVLLTPCVRGSACVRRVRRVLLFCDVAAKVLAAKSKQLLGSSRSRVRNSRDVALLKRGVVDGEDVTEDGNDDDSSGDEPAVSSTAVGGFTTITVVILVLYLCSYTVIKSQDVSHTQLSAFLDPAAARFFNSYPSKLARARLHFIWRFGDPYKPKHPVPHAPLCKQACDEFLAMATTAPLNSTTFIGATCGEHPVADSDAVYTDEKATLVCMATWDSVEFELPRASAEPVQAHYPWPKPDWPSRVHDALYIGSYLTLTSDVDSDVNDATGCRMYFQNLVHSRLGAQLFAGYYWSDSGSNVHVSWMFRRTHFQLVSPLRSLDQIHHSMCWVDGARVVELEEPLYAPVTRDARDNITNVFIGREPTSWLVTPSSQPATAVLLTLLSLIGASWGLISLTRSVTLHIQKRWPSGPRGHCLALLVATVAVTVSALTQVYVLVALNAFSDDALLIWIFCVCLAYAAWWGAFAHLTNPCCQRRRRRLKAEMRHHGAAGQRRCFRCHRWLCCVFSSSSNNNSSSSSSSSSDEDQDKDESTFDYQTFADDAVDK